jgi:hypothetical protein
MVFDDRPEFAKRLEQARIAAGFTTAREACRRKAWTYSTYIQHERGIRGLGRTVDKYAKAYKVQAGWLLGLQEDGGPDAGGSIDEELKHLPPDMDGEELRERLRGVIRTEIDLFTNRRQ